MHVHQSITKTDEKCIPSNFNTAQACMSAQPNSDLVLLRIPFNTNLANLHGLEIQWPPAPTASQTINLSFGNDSVPEVRNLIALFPDTCDKSSPTYHAHTLAHIGSLTHPIESPRDLTSRAGNDLVRARKLPVPVRELPYRSIFDAFGSYTYSEPSADLQSPSATKKSINCHPSSELPDATMGLPVQCAKISATKKRKKSDKNKGNESSVGGDTEQQKKNKKRNVKADK